MIDRHMDSKKKQSVNVERVYNLSPFLSSTCLPHGQIWATVVGETSLTQC